MTEDTPTIDTPEFALWEARQAARTCECVLFHEFGHPACGKPAVARMLTGCVHEHIELDWMCSRHVGLAKRAELICSGCRRGGDSHACQMFALAEVDASGQRRLLAGAGLVAAS